MTTADSTIDSELDAKVRTAREQLDAQVRDMIEWHFRAGVDAWSDCGSYPARAPRS